MAKPYNLAVYNKKGKLNFTRVVDHLMASHITGNKIAYGGGCALNCVANSKMADLLDQLQAAKVHLGIEAGMYANAPIFLEINFKGYEASLEEEDQKGAPKHVSGPFIYELEIAKISIAIDDKGSEYEVMCTVGNR